MFFSTNWHDHGSRARFPARSPAVTSVLGHRDARLRQGRGLQQFSQGYDLQLPYLTLQL
jgi:hypothetical protein